MTTVRVHPIGSFVDAGDMQYPPGADASGSGGGFLVSDGWDGNLTASSGTTTLTRDMYYDTVTLSGTAQIVTNGWLLACKVLDLTAAGANAINWNGNAGGNGSGVTGGTAGTAATAQVVGNNTAGTAGGTGGASGVAGTQAAAVSSVNPGNGGRSNTSGAGGSGNSGANAGGAARAGVAITAQHIMGGFRIPPQQNSGTALARINGGNGGAGGGGGGGGTGGGAGGGGGGGGAGGSVLAVLANEICFSGAAAGAVARPVALSHTRKYSMSPTN